MAAQPDAGAAAGGQRGDLLPAPGGAPLKPRSGKLEALLRCPGTVTVITRQGCLRRVAECGCCERERPIFGRGLCQSCYSMRLDDGTIGSYGYVRADRVEEYARLRSAGCSVVGAGRRLGVTGRTAQRYEAALRDAGMAPWREHAGMRGIRHAA